MAYIGKSVIGVEHPATSALNATTGTFSGIVKTDAIQTNAGKPIVNSTGSVLQVVSTAKTDSFSTTSTMADVTGLSVAITPSSSSNKILILVQIGVVGEDSGVGVRLLRGSTNILIGDTASSRSLHSTTSMFMPASSPHQYNVSNAPIMFLDSPNTTSATTYKVQAGVLSNVVYVNRTIYDVDNGNASRSTSTIIAMEIAG